MKPDYDTTGTDHRGIGEVVLPSPRETPRRAAALSGATHADCSVDTTTVTSIILTC